MILSAPIMEIQSNWWSFSPCQLWKTHWNAEHQFCPLPNDVLLFGFSDLLYVHFKMGYEVLLVKIINITDYLLLLSPKYIFFFFRKAIYVYYFSLLVKLRPCCMVLLSRVPFSVQSRSEVEENLIMKNLNAFFFQLIPTFYQMYEK